MTVLATYAPDSSGHYRIKQPIEELIRQGERGYKAVLRLDLKLKQGRVVDILDLEGVDVVVLQRPATHVMPQAMDVLHAKGIKVVVEIDDDYHTVDVNNRAFLLHHPRVSPLQNWHHLGRCVQKADLVTVSTPALAKRYGSHGRVQVLRNRVDDDWLSYPSRGDGRTLGWAGTPANHPTDLQATRGGVAMAMADNPGWRFLCVGGGDYIDRVQRGLELPEPPIATGWRPLELHPMLVSGMDIGIVPLADTVFNHAKSWLKGVEYSALGIPFVASDLPEYRVLKENYGLGVLASSKAKHWRRRLNVMMNSEDMIEDYRRYARDQVRRYLTISKSAWRWQEVWESLRCRRPTTQRREIA